MDSEEIKNKLIKKVLDEGLSFINSERYSYVQDSKVLRQDSEHLALYKAIYYEFVYSNQYLYTEYILIRGYHVAEIAHKKSELFIRLEHKDIEPNSDKPNYIIIPMITFD